MKQLKKLNKKYLEVVEEPAHFMQKGWTAVSESPQGVFFLSDENTCTVTRNKDEAVIFTNYENAVACLEHFLANVFISNDREGDIVHFFRVEKIEKI